MSFGKFVKTVLTQKVKCDYCGRVIRDGNNYDPAAGNKIFDQELSIFELVKFSRREHNFCSKMCEMAFKTSHQLEELIQYEIESHAQEQQRQETESYSPQRPEINRPANIQSARSANFCTHCGSALKNNTRFCSQCGTRVN